MPFRSGSDAAQIAKATMVKQQLDHQIYRPTVVYMAYDVVFWALSYDMVFGARSFCVFWSVGFQNRKLICRKHWITCCFSVCIYYNQSNRILLWTTTLQKNQKPSPHHTTAQMDVCDFNDKISVNLVLLKKLFLFFFCNGSNETIQIFHLNWKTSENFSIAFFHFFHFSFWLAFFNDGELKCTLLCARWELFLQWSMITTFIESVNVIFTDFTSITTFLPEQTSNSLASSKM